MSVHDLSFDCMTNSLPSSGRAPSHDDYVREFYAACDVPIGVPVSDERIAATRLERLGEELDELGDALADGDVIDVADALADLYYLVRGCALTWGIDLDEAFRAVHASNLFKLVNGRGILGSGDRVLKGPDYRPPNLRAAVAGAP